MSEDQATSSTDASTDSFVQSSDAANQSDMSQPTENISTSESESVVTESPVSSSSAEQETASPPETPKVEEMAQQETSLFDNELKKVFASSKKYETNDEELDDDANQTELVSSKFAFLNVKLLQQLRSEIEREINNLNTEIALKTDHQKDALSGIEWGDPIEQSKSQRRKDQLEQDKERCREQRQKLELELQEIEAEIQSRDSAQSDSSRFDPSMADCAPSAKSLYRVGRSVEDEIINTILYSAAFFPELNVHDFWAVTLGLLKDRKVQDTIEQITIDNGETKTIQVQKEYLLDQYLRDYFEQADRLLENAGLSIRLAQGTEIVDFSFPQLRDEVDSLFSTKATYRMVQIDRVKQFVFDPSIEIAGRACALLADAVAKFPKTYGADWLLALISQSESRRNVLLDRAAMLIYQIQLNLAPTQFQEVVITFLDRLMNVDMHGAIAISSRLLKLHFQKQINVMYYVKPIVSWLKKIINQGRDNQDRQARAYNILLKLLKQKAVQPYLSELFGLLQEWFPCLEQTPQEYLPSNEVALLLIVQYCQDSINSLNPQYYGCWPPKYSLFEWPSLESYSSSRLSFIISCLLLRSGDGFALDALVQPQVTSPSTARNSSAIALISYLVAEWVAILRGLKRETPAEEALQLERNMLQQVIRDTELTEQKQLRTNWSALMEAYLSQADSYEAQGEQDLKQQFRNRRMRIKEIKQTFSVLQQELTCVAEVLV
jgi:hypothetical protein